MTIDDIMRRAPVIPVLVLDGSLDPAALAETLVAAGFPVIEVTLRTPNALDAIRAMATVPGAIVGAGTVLSGAQAEDAVLAGARFLVSPALVPEKHLTLSAHHVLLPPDVATPMPSTKCPFSRG